MAVQLQYFKPLTGIRAIAAFMVFLHHFNPFKETLFYNYTKEFYVGVTMFFVLSGFLIAYRYSDLKEFSFKKYMINRFARIYPMYFFLTGIAFIAFAYRYGAYTLADFGIFLMNITFFKGFFNDIKFTLLSQSWSLTVEETFYLIAPLTFLLINKKRIYLVLLPIFFILLGILLVSIFSKLDFYDFFGNYNFMFNFTFFGRSIEFFIGILLAYLLKDKINFTFKINFKYFTYLGLLGIIISIYLLSLLKGDFDSGIGSTYGKIINTFLLPTIGISLFYYGLIKEKTLISRLLGSSFLVLLGKSSYIFYLIHIGVGNVLAKFTNQFFAIIILWLISINLFKYLEEPFNNYIRNKFNKNIIK
jgi:peptidoglycan/LPS O-acetylase OafA/YrhL